MSTQQISFAIQGMYCVKCAQKIEAALTQLDGVIAAQVNYATERATVVYDPTRIRMAAMVAAVREVEFSIALEPFTLNVRDLIYASSAHTVEQILASPEGIVEVSANLRTGQVTVTALPEYFSPAKFQAQLAALGLHSVPSLANKQARGFLVRLLLSVGTAGLLGLGALSSSFATPIKLSIPFWLDALVALALFGAGYPFYRRALAVLAQSAFDASVLLFLAIAITFFGGLALTLLSQDSQVIGTASGWTAFTFAALLTAGWFITRGVTLWVFPYFRCTPPIGNMPVLQASNSHLGIISDGTRH